MRTRANITIDPDAYNFALAYAGAKGISLSAAVSQLIRRAEAAPEPVSTRLKMGNHGLPVLAKTGRVVTLETVRESSEDDLA